MATRRKASKTKRKSPRAEQGWARLEIPRPTLALLDGISKLVNLSASDIVIGLVNELGENIATYSRKNSAQRIGMLASLLKLPAFNEALLQRPKRKRAASKRSAKRAP